MVRYQIVSEYKTEISGFWAFYMSGILTAQVRRFNYPVFKCFQHLGVWYSDAYCTDANFLSKNKHKILL